MELVEIESQPSPIIKLQPFAAGTAYSSFVIAIGMNPITTPADEASHGLDAHRFDVRDLIKPNSFHGPLWLINDIDGVD